MSQISTTISTYILSKFARQDLNPAVPEQGLTWSFFDKPALVVKLYRTTATPGPYQEALAQLGVARQGHDSPSSMRLEVEWQVDNSVGSSQTQSGESPYSVLCLQKLDFDFQAAGFVGIRPRSELPLKATYQIDMVGFRYIDQSLGPAGPYRRFQLKFPNRADMFRFLGEIEHVCPCAEANSSVVPAEKSTGPAPGNHASKDTSSGGESQRCNSVQEQSRLQDVTNSTGTVSVRQPERGNSHLDATSKRPTAETESACQGHRPAVENREEQDSAAPNLTTVVGQDINSPEVDPIPVKKGAKANKKKPATPGSGDEALQGDVDAGKVPQKQSKTAAKPKAKPKARPGRQTAEVGVQASEPLAPAHLQRTPSRGPSPGPAPRPPYNADGQPANHGPIAPDGPSGPDRLNPQLTLSDLQLPAYAESQERLRWMSQSEIASAFEELLNSAWRDVTVGQLAMKFGNR